MARGRVDAPSEYLGQENTIAIDAIGTGEAPSIEVIDKVVASDNLLEYEKFMQEYVTIMVHDSNNPLDNDIECVQVNGVRQFLQRNKPQAIRRYFVERLARAKTTTYTQDLDERLGEAMNHMKPRHALKFPFSVIEDKNPKGSAWLRNILAERT